MITYRYPELLFILLMPFVGKHRDMLRYRHLYPYISKKSFIWAGEQVMLEQYDEHRLGNSVAVAARIIYRLSKLVPDNMDRSGLFSFFSKELRASFHYDRFSIFLYDAERDFLTAFTAADGTVVEVFSDTRIAQNTVAWQAIQTRKPVVIKNLASLNWGGAVSLASVGLTATIALPLILNRQVIGTLHVSFVRQPDNLVEILNLLQQLSPVLTTFLFVILTEERRARTQAADRAALDSLCETEAAFPLENSLLETKAMTKVMALARKAAKLHIPVLISGETGTGKEVFAQAIHHASPRAKGAFVAVNCSAFSKELLESELFGHRAGSFTGATKDKKGLFEEADKGTLFLDEIGEMPVELQAKLLRVLECGEFIKIGETRPTKVDLRIIAATNRDLEKEIASGNFREDLFFRLSVFRIHLPSLRERPGDIAEYARFFAAQFADRMGRRIDTIDKGYIAALERHAWHGNVRELRNVVERSLIMAEGNALTVGCLSPEFHAASCDGSVPDSMALDALERHHILRVLEYTKGNKAEAARLLGIGIATLYRKLESYGMKP